MSISIESAAPISPLARQGASSPVAVVSASSFAVSGEPASDAPTGNQRTIQDPSIGFITQYLSANDSQVVSQAPSAITVAYLRSGLTAEGVSKSDEAAKSVAATA